MGWRSLFLLLLLFLILQAFFPDIFTPRIRSLAFSGKDAGLSNSTLQVQGKVLREIPDTLLVLTREGLLKISGGSAEVLNKNVTGYTLTLYGDKLYTGCRPMYEISLGGDILKEINVKAPYCLTTVPLPGGRFAALDNKNDRVYILDGEGGVVAIANLTNQPNEHLQNMYGIVVGNKLIVSEDGNGRIMSMDLSTYEVSVLKDLSMVDHKWGPITYDDGTYYVGSQSMLYRFKADGPAEPVVDKIFDHITGIGLVQNRLYVARYVGDIYVVYLDSGEVEKVVEGLNRVMDMVVIPGAGSGPGSGSGEGTTAKPSPKPASTTEISHPGSGSRQPGLTTIVTTVIESEGAFGPIETALLVLIMVLAAIITVLYLRRGRSSP